MAGRKRSRLGKEVITEMPSSSSGSQSKRAKKRKGKEVAEFSSEASGSKRVKKAARAESHSHSQDSRFGLLQFPSSPARPNFLPAERQARDSPPPPSFTPSAPPLVPLQAPPSARPTPSAPPLARPTPSAGPSAPPLARPTPSAGPSAPPPCVTDPYAPFWFMGRLVKPNPLTSSSQWMAALAGPGPAPQFRFSIRRPVKLEPVTDPVRAGPSSAPPLQVRVKQEPVETPPPPPGFSVLRPVTDPAPGPSSARPPQVRVKQEPFETLLPPPGFAGLRPVPPESAVLRSVPPESAVLRSVLPESSDENPDGWNPNPPFAVAHNASGEGSEAPPIVVREEEEDDELASTARGGDGEVRDMDTASSAAEREEARVVDRAGPARRRYFLRSYGPAEVVGDNFKYRI